MKRVIQSQPVWHGVFSRQGFVESANITKPTEDNKRYTAECRGVSAQGDTIEEACDNLSHAIFGPPRLGL